jgi:carotenoid cleavage dioxygenase-like enzyme
VETEKRIFEKKRHRKMFMPNMFGVANTALFHHRNLTYALFERDLPYIIDIDFQKKQIQTIGKYCIEDIAHFSAHSKVKNSFIETIEYAVLQKNVKISQLDSYFRILSSISIPVKYMPMVHDFISTEKNIIFLNSPFTTEFSLVNPKIKMDKTKSAIFYLVDRDKNDQVQRYYVNHAIYIFHYTEVIETEDKVEIYAPVHDSLDLSTLDIKGKYRKIILDKRTNTVKIERNPVLEEYNVEFPVSFQQDNKTKVLLRYVKNGNTGFVLCHALEIEKRIDFPGRCICGEPSIIFVDEIPHAIFFTIDAGENGFFNCLNLETEENEETDMHVKMKIGFHSLYLYRR